MKVINFKSLVLVLSLGLTGCPPESDPGADCEVVMVCNQEKEILCDPPLGTTCGEDICHYYTTETCWEACKSDVESDGI